MNPTWQEPTFPPCAVADAREKGEAASGFDVDDNSTLYKIASQQRQHPPQQAFAMSDEERAMYDTPSRRDTAASQHRREAPPIPTKSPTAHHTLQGQHLQEREGEREREGGEGREGEGRVSVRVVDMPRPRVGTCGC